MLKTLRISHLRNIESSDLELDRCVWFIGKNGAGKSSILEAISLLFTSRSFRSSKINDYISHDSSSCIVFGMFATPDDIHQFQKVGIFKSKNGDSLIKLDGERIKANRLLSLTPPLQVLANDLPNFIDASSSIRRKIIDWGVFHVKHGFLDLWKQYKRILKQRSATLKDYRLGKEVLKSIDSQFVPIALELTEVRERYWSDFIDYLSEYYVEIMSLLELNSKLPMKFDFGFYRGWSNNSTLEEALMKASHSSKLQITPYGPHRSDFKVMINGINAKNFLSRGQKKILNFWLRIKQADYLYDQMGKKTVFILDDVTSEIDEYRSNWLFDQIHRMDYQIFGASPEFKDSFKNFFDRELKVFHVEHGNISNKERTGL